MKETGILIDKLKREMPKKIVRTAEIIAAVAESVCEALSTSIHRRSQQLNISETSHCLNKKRPLQSIAIVIGPG